MKIDSGKYIIAIQVYKYQQQKQQTTPSTTSVIADSLIIVKDSLKLSVTQFLNLGRSDGEDTVGGHG